MSDEATTYRKRLRQYRRRVDMTIWVGAGLAGLLAITTGDAFDSVAPAWLKALEITFIIIGGVCFGLARVKFEWAATQLKRKMADTKAEGTADLSLEDKEWPRAAEIYWNASLVVLFIAGLGMAFCFWHPVIIGKSANQPAAIFNADVGCASRVMAGAKPLTDGCGNRITISVRTLPRFSTH